MPRAFFATDRVFFAILPLLSMLIMRKIIAVLLLLFTMPVCYLQAQICNVDSSYTAAGIYPGDTLPIMYANAPYAETIQFVFPSDTVINGATLPFDSFVVNTINGLPNWLNWECNANHPVCTYITTPNQLTRGCVRIFGTPPDSAVNLPDYDSVIVSGTAWVTLLFAFSIDTDIPIYYQVTDTIIAGLTAPNYTTLGLVVAPNPSQGITNVQFELKEKSMIRLRIVRMDGQEVFLRDWEQFSPGSKALRLKLPQRLSRGLYFLRLETQGGLAATSKLFLE
ncbi:MAG TPA: T9SS type A sorting domain-containing protein [Bacteroidetes bacterium]|nr:T9SS type A sorting domain-containing protein [Bacteroidota bacterium]